MHVSFLNNANILVIVFVKSERALLDKYKIAWLHSQMSNDLEKITENTVFGTTDLYRYCCSMVIMSACYQ